MSRGFCETGLWLCNGARLEGIKNLHFSQKTLKMGHPATIGLQLSPYIFEIVETFFAGEPFGGADCAFGEAAAGFGVVAEIDAVGGGIEHDLV